MSEIKEKRRKLKRYSESLKLEVLTELSKEEQGLKALSLRYNIPESTIATWSRVKTSPRIESGNSIKGRVYMGEEDLKIRELESALADSLLKNKLYEKMFEYAKEDYGIELKKNAVTGQYSLIRKDTGLSGSVKR